MIKHRIAFNPVVDWRFDLLNADGAFLWDTNGKEYIDFTSGWNTTNLGWNNKEINEAVAVQAKKNVYAPMWTADEIQITYSEALTNAFPAELDVICRATGGTEANEMAMKIARAVTGRQEIISFQNTYHGQSFGTLSLGYNPDYVKKIAPLLPKINQIPYPQNNLDAFLDDLETKLKSENIAAVFTEAGMITGWGSMLIAPVGYLKGVRKLTEKYGTLLIVDEVGTGFSRTGKLFAIEHENVIPDIVTLAKGISNGAGAIGATITKSKLLEPNQNLPKLTSTFGWTPLACAAALKTLEIHQRDFVWEQSAKKGELVKTLLKKAQNEGTDIKNIRGQGLEIAFDSEVSYDMIIQNAADKGVHIANAGECIQLMPPLTTSNEILIEGVTTLTSVITNLQSN